MSNVSNTHDFSKLTKDSKPLTGQRLVRLIAKGENKHANLIESLCVSIPRVTTDEVAEAIDRLLPHVVGMVQDAQDKIIREWRIEHGRDDLDGSILSMDNVIEWLDANAAGDRVSSEYLMQWFADEYKATAVRWIAAGLSVDIVNGETPLVVEQKYNVLRDMFIGWASPKYSPAIPKLKAMIKFSENCPVIDGRMNGIIAKARDMLKRKESELENDALGF